MFNITDSILSDRIGSANAQQIKGTQRAGQIGLEVRNYSSILKKYNNNASNVEVQPVIKIEPLKRIPDMRSDNIAIKQLRPPIPNRIPSR